MSKKVLKLLKLLKRDEPWNLSRGRVYWRHLLREKYLLWGKQLQLPGPQHLSEGEGQDGHHVVASSNVHIPAVGLVRTGDSLLLAQEVKLQLPARRHQHQGREKRSTYLVHSTSVNDIRGLWWTRLRPAT